MTDKEAQSLVDDLGHLKAQIAVLEEKEKFICAQLKAHGKWTEERDSKTGKITYRKIIEGNLFRATISRFTKLYLDMDAVREKLGERWCRNHSREQEESRVLVNARKGIFADPALKGKAAKTSVEFVG
jgi:hypothetical protein